MSIHLRILKVLRELIKVCQERSYIDEYSSEDTESDTLAGNHVTKCHIDILAFCVYTILTASSQRGDERRLATMAEQKPDFVTEKHLKYLDGLRESGIINMFGAAPYVQANFELSRKEARQVLSYWMRTFSKRHPKA